MLFNLEQKNKYMNLEELKKAIQEKRKMVWNDPDPIKDNDYTISFIEDISKIEDIDDFPILIQYNSGMSEAQVYLHEIYLK